MHPIKNVVLFRNNEIVYESSPAKKEVTLSFTDKELPTGEETLWYYTRIQTDDEHLTWSSPIWFIKNFSQSAEPNKNKPLQKRPVTFHNYILSIVMPGTIRYKITIFDLKGRITDSWNKFGSQRIILSPKRYSNGKFFYKITSPTIRAIYGEFTVGV